MVREALRERFLETLKENGGSAGNTRLRSELGWQDDTYWAVNQKALNSIMVPVLPVAEQGRVVRRLEAISAGAAELERIYQAKLARIAELRQSILHRAFAGELT
jgi:type I restriction enzyme S subunit